MEMTRLAINPVELTGYAAALTVFATFCMTTMLPLRAIALLSNVLFITYGALGGLYPVLLLHTALLPVNLWRLVQVLRLTKTARAPTFDLALLRRYMTLRRLRAGEILCRRGDPAEEMFFVEAGELGIAEIGRRFLPGDMIGEMGILSRSRRRTATVTARSDSVLLVLTAAKARELWFQHPAFALRVIEVLADRLIDDVAEQAAADLAVDPVPVDSA